MRKRDLTKDELDHVVRLRQAGASWSRIERETSLPRRAVKRAYEEWERSQAKDELSEARTRVAAEEFHEHLRAIEEFSGRLVCHLSISDYDERRRAEQVLQYLKSVRRDRLLYESLRQHTRDNVPWGALDRWASAWDDSVSILGYLHRAAIQQVGNILRHEKPGLQDEIKECGTGEYSDDSLAKSVVKGLWLGANLEAPQNSGLNFTIRETTVGLTEVELGRETQFEFNRKDTADSVAAMCSKVKTDMSVDNREEVERLRKQLQSIRKATGQLEDSLDPLVLRPVLIRTRCDLCPA
jgi:hypothetical protein